MVNAGDLTLEDLVLSDGKLSEQQTKFVVKKLLETVVDLHSQNVCHRDLKPSNVVISSRKDFYAQANDSVKLIDFNVSCKITPDQKSNKDDT